MGKGKSGQNPPDGDKALWEKVTKTVRPYAAARAGAPKPATEGRKTPHKAPATAGKTRSVPPVQAKTMLPAAAPAAFDRGTEESLRRGKWEIDGTLDLHGLRAHAAQDALTRFVLRACKAQKRTLLIITGKGNVREGGGVIRRQLPLWLDMPELRAHILAFTPARPEHGGSGAFYIRLRREKKT
jgi:DNA-nicking Smr family endonuclease